MSNLDFTIANNQYGKYVVPKSSSYTFTSQAILKGKVHEPKTIKYIINNCKDGDVIHAGAGFGDFLPALSKSCKGQVWAFEPEPENFRCAEETIKLNALKNINLFNCALNSKKEYLYLKTREKQKKLGPRCEITTQKKSINLNNYKVVASKTLDSMIPKNRNISLIHLDVEGFEKSVLLGARNLINKFQPIIILEIHTEALKYNSMMLKLGYHPTNQLIYNAGPMVFVNTVYKRQSRLII